MELLLIDIKKKMDYKLTLFTDTENEFKILKDKAGANEDFCDMLIIKEINVVNFNFKDVVKTMKANQKKIDNLNEGIEVLMEEERLYGSLFES